MYYSPQSRIIDDRNSYLHPKQVFCGNYWDEFGLTPFLVPEKAKVLLLGLGFGGGIRSLLSSTKSIDLRCIDIDETTAKRCQELFESNYKGFDFSVEVEDAEVFLAKDKMKYDLIWLDIYDSDRYSPLLFKDEFLRRLRERLREKGVLLTNLYGIPNQFSPLKTISAQREVVVRLQQQFSFVGHWNFRRNMTIAASQNQPPIFAANPHPELSSIDKMSFMSLTNRVRWLAESRPLISEESFHPDEAKFENLDVHMRKGWLDLLVSLRSYGIALERPRDLLSFIQEPEVASRYLNEALNRSDEKLHFAPILAAGESFLNDLNVDWLFDWAIGHKVKLASLFPEQYRQLWLTQLWALVIHPNKKYRHRCFQIASLLQEASQ